MIVDKEKIARKGMEIYNTAVQLIATYGMEIDEEWSRERLDRYPGITVKGKQVYFSEQMIRSHIPFGPLRDDEPGLRIDWTETSFNARAAGSPLSGRPYHAQVGGFAMSVYDVETQNVRASTAKDAREALQLCHVLGIGGPYPCTPTDVSPLMRNIMCHRLCFENAAHCGTHVSTGIHQAQPIYEMHQVMDAQMPITLTAVTPFRIEGNNLQVIRHFYEQGAAKDSLRIVPVGYGLSGMNYPLTLGGSWVLCLAEHMGMYLTATGMETGFSVAPSVGPVGIPPVNLQAMCIATGHPNQVFHNTVNNILVCAALGRDWESAPPAEVGLWTGSPVPDCQAATEKSILAFAGFAEGAMRFGRLGNLCVDDVFSCEQMLTDIDILDYAYSAVHAADKMDAFLDIENLTEEVADVVAGDDAFSTVPSTLKHLRNLYPREAGQFIRMKRASVKDCRLDRLLREQAERKRDLLSHYDYTLPDDKLRALAKIYDDTARR